MDRKISGFIKQYNLLSKGCKVIVGFSGGADSVALLSILTDLGFQCIAAHCNFHLRGEESERDELFARNFALRRNIVFEKIDFDTVGYASIHGISIEMAARTLRYEWFEKLRLQHDAEAIAVAHHRDDQVETVLLNIIRGCGLKGLTGMAPENGYVVRPLLCVSRSEIEDFLDSRRLEFVTDSTNNETVYLRNSVRHELLPLLERYNPSVRSALLRMSHYMEGVEKVYDDAIDRGKKEVMPSSSEIDIDRLFREPSPESLLYSILSRYGFSPAVTDELFNSLSGSSGKVFFSPTHRAVKDRSRILITDKNAKENETFFIENDLCSEQLPFKMSFTIVDFDGDFATLKSLGGAVFDMDKLVFPLTLRRWKKGDFFVPFGMKGRKKISDYFNDHKYSLLQKEEAWLLCSGCDVLWIVGERTDDRYKVVKNTQKMLHITLD
ncbi:MAG: tRNA lysidine(34) synthetase TilS [Bacteroidales bacterium]|nr:tRNA lysidine(34) synthetase TilS [Bacteroidales bacterium]